ncbi:MAG TPA: hypothetical protein VMT46_07335 [Anaerolineaceae bacterium]|nr:hypothetical protein [Anaerolineaceae bacterium]
MNDQQSPQTHSQAGMRAFQAGEYEVAADAFDTAAQGYSAQGDLPSAAEMQNNRSVALLKAGKAAEALVAASGTDEFFAQMGDIRRQGMAIGNQAGALEALGRLKEALEKYQQSADLLKAAGDQASRAHLLESLSALQLRTGNHLQAMATMQAALESKKKLTVRERFLKKLLKVPFRMLGR